MRRGERSGGEAPAACGALNGGFWFGCLHAAGRLLLFLAPPPNSVYLASRPPLAGGHRVRPVRLLWRVWAAVPGGPHWPAHSLRPPCLRAMCFSLHLPPFFVPLSSPSLCCPSSFEPDLWRTPTARCRESRCTVRSMHRCSHATCRTLWSMGMQGAIRVAGQQAAGQPWAGTAGMQGGRSAGAGPSSGRTPAWRSGAAQLHSPLPALQQAQPPIHHSNPAHSPPARLGCRPLSVKARE